MLSVFSKTIVENFSKLFNHFEPQTIICLYFFHFDRAALIQKKNSREFLNNLVLSYCLKIERKI